MHIISQFHFLWINKYIFSFEREIDREGETNAEREKDKSSICFILQVVVKAGAELSQNHDSRTLAGSPTRMIGNQVTGSSFTTFLDSLAGSWIGSRVLGTQNKDSDMRVSYQKILNRGSLNCHSAQPAMNFLNPSYVSIRSVSGYYFQVRIVFFRIL